MAGKQVGPGVREADVRSADEQDHERGQRQRILEGHAQHAGRRRSSWRGARWRGPPARPRGGCGGSKWLRVGVQVSARASEVSSDTPTVTASARKNTPVTR